MLLMLLIMSLLVTRNYCSAASAQSDADSENSAAGVKRSAWFYQQAPQLTHYDDAPARLIPDAHQFQVRAAGTVYCTAELDKRVRSTSGVDIQGE